MTMPAPHPHPDLARLRARHMLDIVDGKREAVLNGWPDPEAVERDLRLDRRLLVVRRSAWPDGLQTTVRRRPDVA